MEPRPSDNAIHFEAIKVAMNQSKDGFKLVLAVHPEDAPERLFRCPVGTRLMVALVEIDDNDQPKMLPQSQEIDPGKEAVSYAGQLCREPAFQRWMFTKGYATTPTLDDTVDGLRRLVGMVSRKELAEDEEKRRVFHQIARAYLRDSR